MQFFALVTGASTGIGPKIGECFAKDQIPLILVSRQVQVLEKVPHDLMQVSKQSIQLISMELSHAQPKMSFSGGLKIWVWPGSTWSTMQA